MLPPVKWSATRGGKLSWKTKEHQSSANSISLGVLDGRVHGVSAWTDETLKSIDELVTTPNFFAEHGFSNKKKDQLIAVYGGGYVLGQKEGDLKAGISCTL